jgi:hypothetical protein
MTDTIPTCENQRGLSFAFGLCALTSFALMANHPRGTAGSFSDVLLDEASHRVINAVVHGGYIAVLVALIVCFVLLSRHLGSTRVPVVIGFVCFCIGSAALIASMLLDGFATPAIAIRFIGSSDLQPARTLLILLGTLIGALMPMGLLFQSVGMLGWSLVIARGSRLGRGVGVLGFVIAIALICGVTMAPARMAMHVVLAGVVLQSLWYGALAMLLFVDTSVASRPSGTI